MQRPDFHTYWIGVAQAISQRGECSRRQVGAIIVSRQMRIVSSGYNGTKPGSELSCLKGDCPRSASGVPGFSSYDTGPGACISTHAEANALLYASRDDREGATMYLTCEPCEGCMRLIRVSGLHRVIYPDPINSMLRIMSV